MLHRYGLHHTRRTRVCTKRRTKKPEFGNRQGTGLDSVELLAFNHQATIFLQQFFDKLTARLSIMYLT